ncbi:MAG: N-acetyltransferase [marine bacterium B5-7]|nr:MAG: N-acetyltransferase [marine bacterium B5-7]
MLKTRTMTREDISFAVDRAGAEGWNPGLHDGQVFYSTDENGFLIGEIDGRPVGCISAVSYEGSFGFVGFYIVIPEMRGRGIGLQIWNAAMSRLDGHNIGLDGVVDQQDNYGKSGFKLCYRNIRFEYTSAGSEQMMPKQLIAIDTSMRNAIYDYDRQCFPLARKRFLDGWLAMPDSTALAFVEGGELHGYGVIRKCRNGFKIGPLFANDANIAQALFDGLCLGVNKGESVYLDVPEINRAALELAERYDMKMVFETARMYTGVPPTVDIDKVFGVTTFELG